MKYSISRLSEREFAESVDALAALLADAVDDGASVGFLAPIIGDELRNWWRSLTTAVGTGQVLIWAARAEDGTPAGTIQLQHPTKPNGRHRAEIAKLIVHRSARGRGLGRELLAVAERTAIDTGVSLLLLDTETGSGAEQLYQSDGWTLTGIVPGYAASPDGALSACSFFHKAIG